MKPSPRVPEQVRRRHLAVGERQGPRVGRLPAHLVDRLRDLVAGRAVLDDQVRDLAFTGERGDRHAPGDVGAGVRDEHLGAVHDPGAVALARRRAGRAGIRPRVGLGEPERREALAARERRDPLPLLLLGAEEEDRHRPERGVRRERDRDRRIDARELLDRDRVRQRVAACASELLGERDPHQAEVGHLRDELVREPRLAVDLLGDGCDSVDCEPADRLAEELVLGRKVEIHARRSYPEQAIPTRRWR